MPFKSGRVHQLAAGPINDLFKIQKSAIRVITGSAYNSHTEPLFKKLQILPLPDLILFNKLQFMQSFNQNLLPSSFNDTWVKNSIRNIGENDIQLCNFDQLCLFLFLFLFQFVPKHTGSFAAVHHFHIFQLFQI